MTSQSAASTAALPGSKDMMTLQQKEAMFLSASKFAVVGASSNSSKFGSKALKYLIEQHKDVVPINPKATEIQGLKCLKSLSELPDPTHTSVSVVVPPNVTLDILRQAKTLGIYALWLQPGAEDDAVVRFIEQDAELHARSVYCTRPVHAPLPAQTHSKPDPSHTSTNLPAVKLATNGLLNPDTSGPCLWINPPSTDEVMSTPVSATLATAPAPATAAPEAAASTTAAIALPVPDTSGPCGLLDELSTPTATDATPTSTAAPPPPLNLAAGVKREMVSPPGTPPFAKSLKLAPDAGDITKEAAFLAHPKFAVVGASNDAAKWGTKVFVALRKHGKDVVPVNLAQGTVQGVSCVKQLADLPDPTHTAVSIVVPPKEALAVLQQAKALGIPALWLQPGVADAAVVQYIADAQLGDRCIYTAPTPGAALHPAVRVAAALPTPGPCLFAYCTALQKKKDSSMDLGDEVPGLA